MTEAPRGSGRVMALDLGTRRIGVAISDETGTVAMPLATLEAVSGALARRQLLEIIGRERPRLVVVGLPLNMDGSSGPMAERCRRFADELAVAGGVEVSLFDERLTTARAERSLLEHDLGRRKRRQVVDRVAAAILLQDWLDLQGRNPP